jgi:hypothetical protein
LAKPDVDLSALAVEVRERVYQLALKAKNEAGMPEPHEQTPAYYDQTIGGRVYLAGRTADPRPLPDQDPSPPSSATPSKPAPTGWLTSWLTGMGIGVAPKPEPAPRVTRLDLVLVANDPAMASGPPLHDYGNAKITYKIERSITFPGDIEGFSAIRDAMQNPAVEIVIAPSALKRINRNTDLVGRQIALVLDGRTVLSAAVLREPLGRRMQLTGNFSLDDISRLVNAISLNPSIGPAAARVESIAPAVHPARPAQTKPASRRIVVNFDALNAFGKAAGVGDKQLADYLAGFGIKLVASTAQRIAAFDERNIYEGKAVKATSGRSVLMQQGGRPVSYTLEFSEPVKSISFNRVALIAGPSGIVHPTWKATALDKAGHTVATAGEDVVRSYANVPAKTFTLSGAGIVRLVVTGDHRGFAAFSSLVLDNLFLVTE